MSQPSVEPPANRIEAQLQQAARHFHYPPTPDIAGEFGQQLTTSKPKRSAPRVPRAAWAALLALLILAGLLFVPQVRAAVVEFLQLGAVRIFLVEPTRTPSPVAPPESSLEATPTTLALLLNLAGETTLEAAQAQVNFPIRLPSIMGPPDRVFVQNLNGPMVILVWLEPGISLHQLGPGVLISKVQPHLIEETTVRNQPAVWVEGPYPLQLTNGSYELRRVIEGHTLIWTEGDITYRLESSRPLTETRQTAESLE